jgi:hypothetical protein
MYALFSRVTPGDTVWQRKSVCFAARDLHRSFQRNTITADNCDPKRAPKKLQRCQCLLQVLDDQVLALQTQASTLHAAHQSLGPRLCTSHTDHYEGTSRHHLGDSTNANNTQQHKKKKNHTKQLMELQKQNQKNCRTRMNPTGVSCGICIVNSGRPRRPRALSLALNTNTPKRRTNLINGSLPKKLP